MKIKEGYHEAEIYMLCIKASDLYKAFHINSPAVGLITFRCPVRQKFREGF